jgi:signal transduction histidine kinase/putative methionine-R-sulfoxide reductase with GAF domain
MTNQNAHQRLEKIVNIMLEMTNIDNFDRLLDKLLEGALNLTTCTNASVMLLDHFTGELEVIKSNKPVTKNKKLKPYSGITGLALKEENPIKADNISDIKWKKHYVEIWEDTRSEIALPLVIDAVNVRIGTEVKTGSKVLGVLNIESPDVNTFSEEDKQQLWLLVRHAAMLLDRHEYDKKISQLRQIEREIANERDYDQIMQSIVLGITKTHKFKFANISLVDREDNCIKTKYLAGMPEYKQKIFKKMAIHSLDGDDIQADIVRNKQIEVLEGYDPRLDQKIFEEFGHENIIRVFIPMIELSTNNVLGTLEAGYVKEYRKYIYEQDTQILGNFVNYVAQALEVRKSDQIQRITHEFKSPIVGIRSHANFMQRRFKQLPDNLIQKKFNDIISDCEILLYQVEKLYYTFGKTKHLTVKIEKTLIFRDVIIKTINQIRPEVIDNGFSIYDIEYPDNCNRIAIFTDKAKINQVVYNLLINSIKYAEEDPKKFKIKLEIEDRYNQLHIKFQDWGIGIRSEYRDKIFEEGFRSPEVINKNVLGSGIGLTIARTIMKKFGGDLELTNSYKPTEFQMTLPKKSKEELEDDLIRG